MRPFDSYWKTFHSPYLAPLTSVEGAYPKQALIEASHISSVECCGDVFRLNYLWTP